MVTDRQIDRRRTMRWTNTILAAAMVLALVGPAMAGDWEDAKAADERGDYAIELRLLTPLADQGNATAQFNLGYLYDMSRGVPKDDAQAMKWYRLAADQDNADTQFNLGVMYANEPHGL
jgi:uncharacterized protein